MLFAAVLLGTLIFSANAYPDCILEEASLIALPLALVALLPTSVWVVMTYPTPTSNAPERLAFTLARAVAEHVGTDVYVTYFTNFLLLAVYYLQLKLGSYLDSGLAHLLCLVLLYLEKAAPRKRIMVATVMVLTIVMSSDDHPNMILYKFVMLVTIVPTCVAVGAIAVAFAILISNERFYRAFVRPVGIYVFADRNFGDEPAAAAPLHAIRLDIAPTTGYAATVLSQLNADECCATEMCVEEADAESPTDEMIALTTAHPAPAPVIDQVQIRVIESHQENPNRGCCFC